MKNSLLTDRMHSSVSKTEKQTKKKTTKNLAEYVVEPSNTFSIYILKTQTRSYHFPA